MGPEHLVARVGAVAVEGRLHVHDELAHDFLPVFFSSE
jgi:hypothetical protein